MTYSNDSLDEIIASAKNDNQAWFPDVAQDPFFMTACMAGEVGEVLNHLKKVARGTHNYSAEMHEEVAEELADVLTYLASVAGMLGIDLADEYWKKRAKNDVRFRARKSLEEPDGTWTQNTSPQPQTWMGDETQVMRLPEIRS